MSSLTPRQIVKLYYKAGEKCDAELLRKIMYFPPGTSEAEIEKKIGPSSRSVSVDEIAAENIMKMVGMKTVVEYDKILNKDTAEVGVIIKVGVGPLSKRIPVDQVVLKRDEGIWKIHYSRINLTKEQLIDTIRGNPQSAWAYYCYGMNTQSDNFYRAYRYYKKYYELEPKGFWVSDEFLEKLDKWGDFRGQEHELLDLLQKNLPNSTGMMCDYIRLYQLYIENGKNEEAEAYLEEAGKIVRRKGKLAPH